MAYEEHAVSSLAQVAGLLAPFAANLGWTVSTTDPATPGFLRSDIVGAQNFRLTSVSEAAELRELRVSITNSPDYRAAIRSPRWSAPGNAGPILQPLTKVHLLGGVDPTPWLAVVAEYGFNLYRHLYFGHTQIFGGYTGGEVVTAANAPLSNNIGAVNFLNDIYNQYMFSSLRSANWASESKGWAHFDHPNNPNPFRLFNNTVSASDVVFTNDRVMGGFGDSINDAYFARGLSGFAGAAVFGPINLFLTDTAPGSYILRPAGKPSGIRHVRMDFLSPAQQVALGDETWICFPAWCRSVETVMPVGTGAASGYRGFETSNMVGYAYRIS